MDTVLMLHDRQEYEILVVNYMALDLLILEILLDQKYLNPMMKSETTSDAEMKQNLVSKS